MAKDTHDTNIRSLALGIVLGMTFTAVCVSLLSLFAVNDFNRDVRFTLDRVRSTIFNDESRIFAYPHQKSIMSYDVSGWKESYIDTLKLKLKLPPTWSVSSKEIDCGKADSCQEFKITAERGSAKISLREGDQTVFAKMSYFPEVINIGGKDTIIRLYRDDVCTKNECKPNPTGRIRYATFDLVLNGIALRMYLETTPQIETATVLYLLNFD